MKKIRFILVICVALFMGVSEVRAQASPYGTYSLSIGIVSVENASSLTFFRVETGFENFISGGWHLFFHWSSGIGPGGVAPFPTGTQTREFSTFVREIHTSRISFRSNIPNSNVLDTSPRVYSLDPLLPFVIDHRITHGRRDLHGVINQPLLLVNSEFSLTLLPTDIRFFNDKGEITEAIPLVNDISTTIRASEGFQPAVYNWQYAIGYGGWQDFPPSLQNRCIISFRGTDLFSDEKFARLVYDNTPIRIRINALTYRTHNLGYSPRTFVLNPMLSAPRITGVQTIHPASYAGATDAVVRVRFDRNLYVSDNEIIIVLIHNESTDNYEVTQANPGVGALYRDSYGYYTILRYVQSGDRRFKVFGTLNERTTYNEAAGHREIYTVQYNRAVEHSIHINNHISCYGVEDGRITVTAWGGVGEFTAWLYRNSNRLPGEITFLESESAVFYDLEPGTYRVHVVDFNNIESENNDTTVTIISPPSRVTVVYELSEDPEAYNSYDGWVTVRVSGGTRNNTGHKYTVRILGRESMLPTEEVDGDDVLYTFTGLGAGDFSIIVQDANFTYPASADCTCRDVFHFTLTAPIILGTSSTDVSCHSGSDGTITVSATGGSGSFIAILYESGIFGNTFIEDAPFLQADSIVFSGLSHGSYVIRVVDANDANLYDVSDIIEITQPSELTVILEDSLTIEPLAHESQDGEITVRVSGGTRNATDGYNVVLTHPDGRTTSPTSYAIVGDDILYTFTGLGRGDHRITIQDGNNCETILNFTMTAPPPLIVTIEEVSGISWYGAAQGELVARATGGVPHSMGMPYTFTWYKEENGVMQPLTLPNDSIANNLLAGLYQVRITDANGISRTSATHYLTQPSLIEVEFTVVAPNCYGTRGGSITAHVIGGFPPFRFEWCVEGATGNELTSLEAGIYRLVVTDTRGGRNDSFIEVPPAGNLIINSQVVQPTCLVPEGSVTLTLSGAEPPFLVRWTDRAETLSVAPNETITRGGLISGTYTVEVTDGNGCLSIFAFTIEEPRVFTVSLGNDLVMNRNQSRTIEAISNEPNLTYLWYFNDTRLPDSGNSILVDRAGEFSVVATSDQGCVATDRINVRMTNYVLDLDMTVPTKVEIGSPIHAVNLSTMSTDRIDWLLPEGATIIEQSDTRLIFKLNETGSHTISMEGFRGEGATLVTRTIQVVGIGEVELSDESLIRQFWASPNPSTGEFRVLVELNQPGDFTMRLYSPDGVLMDAREGRNVERETFDYEIAGTLQGTFILHLITGADKSVLQVVIRR